MKLLVSAAFAALTAQVTTFEQAVDVRIVVVDVVVVDDDGAFIGGLQPTDLIVLEDGVERPVTSLREIHHAAADRTPPPALVPMLVDEPDPPTRTVTPALPPRHFVFLFDLSSITSTNMGRFWRLGAVASDWAEHNLRREDRVTIATFRRSLRLLVDDQPFSAELLGILQSVTRDHPDHRIDMSLLTDGFLRDPTAVDPQSLDPETLFDADTARRIEEGDRQAVMRQLVSALEALAHNMAGKRGRKAVFLISGGHAFTAESTRHGPLARRIQASLGRHYQTADTAIYSLHAAGLQTTGLPASQRPTSFAFTREGFYQPTTSGVMLRDIMASQELLRLLAQETGGRMIKNTNAFDAGFADLARDLNSYYQISYIPREAAGTGFRRIAVRVRGRDAHLRHKKGYFPLKPYADMSSREREVALTSALGGSTRMPPLFVDGRVYPLYGDSRAAWLALTVAIPPHTLTVAADADNRVTVLAEARNRLGAPIVRLHDVLRLEPDDGPRVARHGLTYTGALEIPRVVGTLRVVVRDDRTGRTSVEDLPFDLVEPGPAPVLLAANDAPLLARGDNIAERALLEFAGAPQRPRPSVRIGGDATLSVLVSAPKGSHAASDVRFQLIDDHGQAYAVPSRFESSGGRILADLELPDVTPGRYSLRYQARRGDDPLVGETAVVVE